jgi:hypothetical protein
MANDAEHLEFQRLQALRGTGLPTSATPPELDEICRRAKEHFRAAVAMVTCVNKEMLAVRKCRLVRQSSFLLP